jgi:hypothetical protein
MKLAYLKENTVLTKPREPVARTTFDPNNKKHQESLKTFLATGNWGGIQFYVEEPYTTVPMTVLTKFAKAKLR